MRKQKAASSKALPKFYAGERYFPDDLPEQHWYQPTPRGLEAKIAEKLAHLRRLDEEAG